MISILLPSRGRPENISRLFDSIKATATGDWEMVVRLDEDDAQNYPRIKSLNIKYIVGPRDVLSKYWNECYEAAKGPFYMHCGDDIIFRTPDWDTAVIAAFPEDKIAFVHGDDMGGNGPNFGTHGFIHKKWAETVGYFVPPYFSSDYNDTWLNDVANQLQRRFYVGIQTEHMHPAFGKGPMDQTHEERLARHRADGVDALYVSMATQRNEDVAKLRNVIDNGL